MELNSNPSITRFFFIRHGQTQHNKLKILQGHLDTSLNEEGLTQASKLATAIAPQLSQIDSVYSSDLQRCRETLNQVLESDEGKGKHKGEVVYNKKFRERFMGPIQGMKVDEAIDYASAQGLSHYKQLGELPHDFHSRVLALIEELQQEKDKKNVIVVSHGGFIRALLKCLGFQQDDFIVYNTSITTVQYDHNEKKWTILNVGSTSHLGKGVFKVEDYRLR